MWNPFSGFHHPKVLDSIVDLVSKHPPAETGVLCEITANPEAHQGKDVEQDEKILRRSLHRVWGMVMERMP